jgi:hypothetical protein
MGLSQTLLDEVGHQIADAYGQATDDGLMERVTYTQKRSATETGATHRGVEVRMKHYRLSQLVLDVILPTDLECRIQTSLVTWQPSDFDVLTRADGSQWQVKGVDGGRGHVWYRLQVRQVR